MTTATADDTIRQLQAQWKKQKKALQIDFKSQLTKMDNTVKNVLTRMGEIETRIDAKITTMQTNLTDMIEKKLATKTIVAQVAAVLGGDTSPFVTAASLKATMESFITQVNTRLDSLATIPTDPDSKRQRRSTSPNHTSDYEDAMEEDENTNPADAAKKVAGRYK
jgi:hypothetical protein